MSGLSIPAFPSDAKAARTPRGFELEELNFLGTGTQLGIGFKSGRRSRFETHPLPRSPARLVLVGPGDRVLGQQRRPPRAVLARASVLRARQPLGWRRFAARRPAHRLALRPRRNRRPVRDAREVLDYLLGPLRRAGQRLGAAPVGRPDLRRPRIRGGARCAGSAIAAARRPHAGVSVGRRRVGRGLVPHRAQSRPDREDRGLLARLARARATWIRELVVRAPIATRSCWRATCRRDWS